MDALVKLYLEDMMTPRNNKSFTITEYRNLSVDIQSPEEVYNDIPVSYTHLDVYKRQSISLGGCARACATCFTTASVK